MARLKDSASRNRDIEEAVERVGTMPFCYEGKAFVSPNLLR